ncbi:MAG: isocitrate lyase/phosphoenolpyruvate mutase family protein [Chitinophagales bacterium]|nr:isocitrate lyase/phosphoenolpyruvate mutase family protein [Chitinophagales bacterium]
MNNYEIFHNLHQQNKPLIIANAWNVTSARVFLDNGYKAIATSSSAIANSLGYEDGEKISFGEMFFVVQRIISGIDIPLSVDMETGYSPNISEVITNIEKLFDIGVVGINLEDSQGKDLFIEKLTRIKNHLARKNMQLFVNARTDSFLENLPAALELTLDRLHPYEEAGADGIFVPFVKEKDEIKKITSATTLPVNVLCMPDLRSIEDLAECGVRRISMGSFLFKAHYNQLDKLIKNIIAKQSFAPLF